MKTVGSLKEIERRAYFSTFQDGIYDILFGLIFLILAWIPVLEIAGFSRFFGYLLLVLSVSLLPLLGKRYITVPRVGSVEFAPKRKKRMWLLLAIGAGVFVLTFPLLIMIISRDNSGHIGWPLIAMFVAPLLVIALYLLAFPRLFVYAALLMACIAESEFLLEYIGAPLNGIISFGIPGVIILGIGLTLLARFMKRYPKLASEVNHVS